jgi:hypothetical protein
MYYLYVGEHAEKWSAAGSCVIQTRSEAKDGGTKPLGVPAGDAELNALSAWLLQFPQIPSYPLFFVSPSPPLRPSLFVLACLSHVSFHFPFQVLPAPMCAHARIFLPRWECAKSISAHTVNGANTRTHTHMSSCLLSKKTAQDIQKKPAHHICCSDW